MSVRALLVAALIALAQVAIATAAYGKEAAPAAADPVAHERAAKLAAELRCLVCQNQSIAESNAELAVDLRRQIDEQIGAGRSDREIADFMVQRYGDFVLYRPPWKATTVLLWAGPALLALLGIAIAWRILRARGLRQAEPPLTAEEQQEATRLLARADGGQAS